MAPWAARGAVWMFGKWRTRRDLDEIARTAQALTDDEIVKVIACCEPETEQGVYAKEVRIVLRILSVAPVGIQPYRIRYTANAWRSGKQIGRIEQPPMSFSSMELRAGTEHPLPVLFPLETEVLVGAAVQVDVTGEVDIYGPWASETRSVGFRDSVFACVTRGISDETP